MSSQPHGAVNDQLIAQIQPFCDGWVEDANLVTGDSSVFGRRALCRTGSVDFSQHDATRQDDARDRHRDIPRRFKAARVPTRGRVRVPNTCGDIQPRSTVVSTRLMYGRNGSGGGHGHGEALSLNSRPHHRSPGKPIALSGTSLLDPRLQSWGEGSNAAPLRDPSLGPGPPERELGETLPWTPPVVASGLESVASAATGSGNLHPAGTRGLLSSRGGRYAAVK
jgi:hypothetical protein